MSIRLENVSKSFDDKVIFDDFSYEFPKNGVVAVTGTTGCGKTTLLRLIMGLEKADSGAVLGNDCAFAPVFQKSRLLPGQTALENILFVTGKSGEQAAVDMLCAVGLSGEENTREDELSGGMAQRVALARALVCDGVLVLDEPFKGLDENTKKSILPLITERAKKDLVIMVTHDADDVVSLSAQELKL